MKNQLTIGLEGGLGNRMRVAASAAAIARHLDGGVAALWTDQWGMHCRFNELFLPCATDRFCLRDATLRERIVVARPRPRNRLVAKALHKFFFKSAIYNDEVTALCERDFDFVHWATTNKPALMWTWWNFYPYEPTLLGQLFCPQPAIQQRIDERTADFTPPTIGLHIRRTDNQESIRQSPTSLFFEVVDAELQRDASTHIYLATDDQATKAEFLQRYGRQRLTTPTEQASRDNVRGIQDAVVELYTLSHTRHIYGSAASSFSEIAAQLGGVPLTTLKIPEQ